MKFNEIEQTPKWMNFQNVDKISRNKKMKAKKKNMKVSRIIYEWNQTLEHLLNAFKCQLKEKFIIFIDAGVIKTKVKQKWMQIQKANSKTIFYVSFNDITKNMKCFSTK